MVLSRVQQPKSKRGKKYLEEREPKATENTKTAMFIRGKSVTELLNNVLRDLYLLKKPSAIMYNRKNEILPFENPSKLEHFSQRNDASLFAFAHHTKKRPNSLILGHLFNFEVLDMIELGIVNYQSIQSFKNTKISFGTKPCLIFAGEAFDEDIEYQRLKVLLIDFFRGPQAQHIRLSGLEHVLSFTAIDGDIYLNSYRVLLKKSGSRTPRVELEEIGPFLHMQLRRTKLASSDLYRQATKQHRIDKMKVKKNISKDPFGTIKGRIHMERLDLDKMQTRKIKGLKRHLTPKDMVDDSENTANKQIRVESDTEQIGDMR